MSSPKAPPTPDNDNDPVRAVREKIIQLAREIEEYSKKSDLTPKIFFTEFLKRVIAEIGRAHV